MNSPKTARKFYEEMAECRKLEQSAAYDHFRTAIELHCPRVHTAMDAAGSDWYDVAEVQEENFPLVRDAVRYLQLMQLLRRWPGSMHIVRILDEPAEPVGHRKHAAEVD